MNVTSDTLFAGSSEMAALMRCKDWSQTPLGAVENWHQSLRIATSICLNSRFPMVIWWSQDLVLLYNDAWRPILGKKHPQALGRPGQEVWSEIWDIIGVQLKSVLATGQATWSDDMLLLVDRYGFVEEAYFTYSYSPIFLETSEVGGAFTAVTETTQRVIGSRQLSTLRELAANIAEAKSIEETCHKALATLASNPYDIPFALLYLVENDGKQARLVGTAGMEAGTPASPEIVDFTQLCDRWNLGRVCKTNEAEIIQDLKTQFGILPGGAWEEPARAAIVLPIAQAGQKHQLAGLLVLGISPRREFEDTYRGFFDLVASNVATALADASAYEEERKRAEALAELDRAKTLFFNNVSHEFRTPLTLMLGPTEDALTDTSDPLSPQQQERIELVQRNGLRLLKLVNTLLDFSRIEAGRVQAVYSPTDLATFTAELASVFRSAIERAGVRLIVNCPPLAFPIYVDREMWEKIVLNLLSNAFKFTFAGEIAVQLAAGAGSVELTVRDTGIGIPEAEISHLFERFHRVKGSRGRSFEGSGIGLSLVQELVKLHGGTIQVASVEGKGSCFTVSIPTGTAHLPEDRIGATRTLTSTSAGAAPFVEEALRWLPEAAPESSKDGEVYLPYSSSLASPMARILLADDNADMLDYVKRLLSTRYEVEAVTNGVDALNAIRQHPPDLVLTDVMMPGIDGFELLRSLRTDPSTSQVPIILLSARAGEESRVEGLEAGADDYLIKPFSARELLARVEATLKVAKLRQDAAEQRLAIEQQNAQRLQKLAQAALTVNSTLSLNERLQLITEQVRDIIGAHQSVTSMTVDDNWAQAIHSVSLSSKYAQWQNYAQKPDLTGIYSHVCREQRPVRMTQAELEAHPAWRGCGKEKTQHQPLRGWLAAPLTGSNGKNIGLIQLSDKYEGEFTAEDEAILVQLAQMASAAIDNARLYEESLRANRIKDEFLAVLSHELRSPLNPILGWTKLLQTRQFDQATTQRALATIERNAKLQTQLIEDLLDVSRILRGKMVVNVARVNLVTVIEAAIETVRLAAESKNIQIQTWFAPDVGFVSGDAARLQQIVWNLLSNAVKFTPAGGRVEIRLGIVENSAEIQAIDTGKGIKPEFLPYVFDYFRQEDGNTTRQFGGLGLGLAIVRYITELHGGSVQVSSPGEEKGATFTVKLPLVKDEGREINEENSSLLLNSHLSPLAGLHVLVVDDEPDMRDLMSIVLLEAGAEVSIAADASQALSFLAQNKPNILVSDIGMPDVDGYMLMRQVRSLEAEQGGQIPAIALTAYAGEIDRSHALGAGFQRHLPKPIDPDTLIEAIADLVKFNQ